MEFFRRVDIKKAITHNFWLKLAALIVAVFIWLYVSGLITSGGRNI
ncbi:MAG: hypothetical protein PHU64_03305 [Candidatus Omnitrophica bacterium]|nr:hypothetical protein [Candidatus Omnitrophota bacterium]MDD5430131.1 hypothetical protein [Candidatus Omnitrophota bacterium]